MHLSVILFSILAAGIVWMVGRRDTANSPRLTAAALILLLASPALSLLPKLHILPTTAEQPGLTEGSSLASWTTLWLTGSFILMVRRFAGYQLLRWRMDSKPCEVLWDKGRKVEVRTRPALQSPHASGIFHPVIFLPEQSSQWPAGIRSMVIAHELAHHRRHDPLWRLIAEITCVIHWFNPFVWWLARHHAIQSEFACDAMVVSNGVHPDRYAEALCDLAASGPSLALAPALNQPSGLHKRVVRLMEPKTNFSPRLATLLAALVLLLGTSMVLLRPIAPGESPEPEEIHLRLTADPFPGNR